MPYKERPGKSFRWIIYYTPYLEFMTKMSFDEPDKIIFAKTWDEVMRFLEEHGSGTKASILSDGTISYFLSILKYTRKEK